MALYILSVREFAAFASLVTGVSETGLAERVLKKLRKMNQTNANEDTGADGLHESACLDWILATPSA